MKINRKLNLVLPLLDDDDKTYAYVHHTPPSQDVFETYFLTLSRTFVAMQEMGGEWLGSMGPRTALLMLQKVSEQEGSWIPTDAAGAPLLDADKRPVVEGIKSGFLPLLWRQTHIVTSTSGSWDPVPFETAKAQSLLSAEDFKEVENAVTFFTLVSLSMKAKMSNAFLTVVFGLLDGLTTSSNVTEFVSSLPTLTPAESSGGMQTTSSLPV